MDWDAKETALFAAALGGHYADWRTTKEAVGRGAIERNPNLGERPSGADIDRYFALTGLLGGAGVSVLPKELRRPLMGAYAGLSGTFASQNTKGQKDAPKKSAEESIKGPLMMAAIGGLLGHLMDDDGGFKVEPAGVRFSKKDNEVRIAFRKDF